MAQIFHPSMNPLSKVSVFGAVFMVLAALWLGGWIQRSPYVTAVSVPREQPVPFSHEHHAAGLGIDCRYCHTSVMDSAFAGIPSTKTCMTCHSQIWKTADALAPVRASWATGVPIRWKRVHDLPDFVYFHHGIHVRNGIGCSTCHGRVNSMPLTWKTETLYMEWCLECHRQPEKFLRPRDRVLDMDWRPPADQIVLGRGLVERLGIAKERLSDCSTCHR
jgi:hypothetical protein